MDRAHPLYTRATTVTVATETYHLFFLSATEESLELVLALCHFIAVLRALQSLKYVALLHFSCHVATIAMPPFNHTLHQTSWKAGLCVSSLIELFGPW